MLVSGEGLRSRLGKSIRIKPFREENLSGVSYDLTLAKEFLRIKEDETCIVDPSDPCVVTERTLANDYVLQPGRFVLARTEEWVDLDGTVMGLISGRSGLARLGLHVESAAVIHPGASGYIVLEVQNQGGVPFRLLRGLKIAQIVFFELTDEVEKYASRKGVTFGTQRAIEIPESLKFSD